MTARNREIATNFVLGFSNSKFVNPLTAEKYLAKNIEEMLNDAERSAFLDVIETHKRWKKETNSPLEKEMQQLYIKRHRSIMERRLKK